MRSQRGREDSMVLRLAIGISRDSIVGPKRPRNGLDEGFLWGHHTRDRRMSAAGPVHGELQRRSTAELQRWIDETCGSNGECPIVARPAIGSWHFTGFNCGIGGCPRRVPWMANCRFTAELHQWIDGKCGLNGGCPIVARPAIGSWLFKGLNCGQASQRMNDKHFRDWIFVDIIQ